MPEITPTRALSVRGPWWWAIPHLGKDIENRDWTTQLRGRVWLHASSWWRNYEGLDTIQDVARIAATTGVRAPDSAFPLGPDGKPDRRLTGRMMKERGGRIVGSVEIVDCVDRSASPWFFGRHGFVLRDPRPLATPVPCKGALGFFKAPVDVLARLGVEVGG